MRSSRTWTLLVLLCGMTCSVCFAQKNVLKIETVKLSIAPTFMTTSSVDFKRNFTEDDLLLNNTGQLGFDFAAEIWWANRLFGKIFLKYFLPIEYENGIDLNIGMRGLGLGYDFVANEDWELITTLSFANQTFRLKNTSGLDRFDAYGFQLGVSGSKKVWQQKGSLGLGLGYSRNFTPLNYQLFIDQPNLAKGSVFSNLGLSLIARFDLFSRRNGE